MIELDPEVVYKLKQFTKEVLLPPNGFVTLAVLGVLIARWRRHGRNFGTGLALLAILALYLSSIPPGSRWLMAQVEGAAGPGLTEANARALMKAADPPQALVILGGGQTYDRREQPHQRNLSPEALARVHAGARIARWTGLPILTTGGEPSGGGQSEAQTMARVLREDLLTAVRWTEKASRDTADNATMSARLLQREKIKHIVLVTQAFHIPRSKIAFEALGIKVTPAPMGFLSRLGAPYESYWIPVTTSRQRAAHAWREIIGQIWYGLRRDYLTPWLGPFAKTAAS